MENKLLQALTSHYQSRIHRAEANLLVYFKSPAGIGEHPDVVGEMAKLVDEIANCRGCLDTVSALVQPADTADAPSES